MRKFFTDYVVQRVANSACLPLCNILIHVADGFALILGLIVGQFILIIHNFVWLVLTSKEYIYIILRIGSISRRETLDGQCSTLLFSVLMNVLW